MIIENSADAAPPIGLANRLWARTEALHRQAERTGVFQDLLRGRAGRSAYALLLRNLLPVYEALEHGLDAHRRSPVLGPLARPEVYRAAALAADLDGLEGTELPVLACARHYAERVAAAGSGDGTLLIAHAYVRYLGDLNGGQILKRLLAKHLDLDGASLGFYDFATDPDALAKDYRERIDAAGASLAKLEALLDEACSAFRMNIALSEAVQAEAARSKPVPRQTGDA